VGGDRRGGGGGGGAHGFQVRVRVRDLGLLGEGLHGRRPYVDARGGGRPGGGCGSMEDPPSPRYKFHT
jgi:hypothetical protein